MPGSNYIVDNKFDVTDSLAVDAAGDIFVVGSVDTAAGYDPFVSRRDALGVEVWSDTWTSPSSDTVEGIDVALDSEGNVYALGMSISLDTFGFATWLRKYSSDGVEQWTEDLEILGTSFAVDGDDNILIGGSVDGSFAVYKYNADLVLQWAAAPETPEASGIVESLALDADGNAYASGAHYAAGQVFESAVYM